jgi:GAF domain-containing protein
VTTLVQSGELERVGPESYDWLGIPLKIDKQTIGAIVVQSYVDGIGYDKSHESILTFISKQIALAIERKRQEDILLHQRDQLVAKSAELSMSYESIRELADEQGIGHALVNDNEIIEYAN